MSKTYTEQDVLDAIEKSGGDITAEELLEAHFPKVPARSKRAIGNLNKIMEEVKTVFPDAKGEGGRMQPTFKIEKGITVPKKRVPAAKNSYPFDQMELGDSFFVEAHIAEPQAVRSATSYYTQMYGGKMITRSVEGGTRVWRVG